MAVCAVCGEEIARSPVWVALADKGVRYPNEKFALHEKHYPEDGMVPAREKIGEVENPDGSVTFQYRDYMTQRYVRVDPPDG